MNNVHKMSISALFLALGLLLPTAFHIFTPNAGAILLPMHIPVLLCGFICGPIYGALIGIMTPLLSSMLMGMPPLYPTAIAMVFELMTYGWLSGWLMKRYQIYVSLLFTMISGRIVSGLMNLILLSYMGKAYTLELFLGAAIVTAIPGILLQLVLIPSTLNIIKVVKQKKQED